MIDSPAIGAITADPNTPNPPYTAAVNAVNRTPAPVSTQPAEDLVNLSPAAQALLLQQSGLTVTEIAEQLEIPVNTVLGDLGIVTASPQVSAATA